MASVEFFDGLNQKPLPGVEGSGSQSFKAGDLIKFTNGTIVVASDGAIDGIAAQDATGTTSAAITYYPLILDAIYSVRYKASATAQTLVGAKVDCTVFTAGAMTWDESGAATDAFVVALDPRDAVTTTSGRLLIRFLPVNVA